MKIGKGRPFLAQAYLFSVTLHLVVLVVFSAWNYRVLSKPRFEDFSELILYEISATRTERKEVMLPANRANDKDVLNVKEKPTPKPDRKLESPADVGAKNRVNVEANDFPFAYYLRLMRNRIQENWDPPYQAGDVTSKTNAIVSFKIQRNGSVTEIMVKNSSGKYMFDAAAQRAIVAAKLPPLPDEYVMEQLNVTIDFEATWQN